MRLVPSIWMAMLAAAVAALAAPAAALPADQPLAATDDSKICGIETLRQERLQSVPDRLLLAISLVESGRWDADRKASFAWPWTVTAESEGHFLPSKTAAIAEVRKLQAKGVTNIDVGCMQVNLQAHPDAFASLDEAFDPAINVAYGAHFLADLRVGTPDWATAGAYYHSQTPALAAAYKAKLLAAWREVRSRPDDREIAVADAANADERPPIGLVLPTPARSVAELQRELAADGSKASAAGAADRAIKLSRTLAERAEAKRVADAYREARLAEYRRHKLQLADAHS